MEPNIEVKNTKCLKIFVAGPHNSGKSNIVLRYCKNEFQSKNIGINGVDFSLKTISISGQSITLKIFDPDYGDRLKIPLSIYFRIAPTIFFVYEKSSRKSLSHLEDYLNKATLHSVRNATYIVVANKSDLLPDVTFEEGNEIANRFEAFYIEVSALSRENIDYLFEIAAYMTLGKQTLK